MKFNPIQYEPDAMKFYLYVDDERKPEFKPDDYQIRAWARSYEAARSIISAFEDRDLVCIYLDLDHDLGEEKTGYDICKDIIEYGVKNVKFHVHSMNPVGRNNIRELMLHYGYEEF